MKEYKSALIDQLIEEMEKDPWYIKLKREISLRYWIFRCNLRHHFKKIRCKVFGHNYAYDNENVPLAYYTRINNGVLVCTKCNKVIIID